MTGCVGCAVVLCSVVCVCVCVCVCALSVYMQKKIMQKNIFNFDNKRNNNTTYCTACSCAYQ